MKSKTLVRWSSALGALLLAGSVYAANAINTFGEGGGYFSDPPRTDVAIRGYDTVAYFTDHKPVMGKDGFVYEWMGAKWKFASQEHLDLFKADPAKYAPQYGGYCAYGVAKDHLVKIEPDQWSVVGGKLYLNYDASVSAKWKKDIPGYIKTADDKFKVIIKK